MIPDLCPLWRVNARLSRQPDRTRVQSGHGPHLYELHDVLLDRA